MAGLNSVGFSNSDNEVDLEGLRTRLREMSDAELLRYGQAAQSMCSPDAYFGQAPRQTFVIQLAEARAELERRRQINRHSRSHGCEGYGFLCICVRGTTV
jgi:hypothetical protein